MLTSAVRFRAVRGGSLLLTAVAGVTAMLAGCSAGQNAQTSAKEPSVPGVHANLGEIALRNVQVAYPGREQRSYPRNGSAPLNVRIFNTGSAADALVAVSSEVAREVVLVGSPQNETSGVCPAASVGVPAGQPAPAPPGGSPGTPGPAGGARPGGSAEFSVALAPDSCALLDTGQAHHLELTGLRRPLSPGETVPVTFTFRDAGEVTLDVPFGPPSEGPEHSPLDIHPVEPPVVGGHDTDGEAGH